MNTAARRAPQRGQAMTEIVVIAAVLIPLFLLVPVLAKYIHLRQTAQQATRAAAWEASVSSQYRLPATGPQKELLLDRQFGAGSDPILSAASAAPGDARVGNVMMNTVSGDALVRRSDVVLDAYGDEAPSALGSLVAGLLDVLPSPWSTPNTRGLVTAHLTVSPQNLRNRDGGNAAYLAPFDTIDLRFAQRHSLLADAWNASGPGTGATFGDGARSVRNQVVGLVPSAKLSDCSNPDPLLPPVLCPIAEINEALAPFEKILPIVLVPTRLEPGLIEPDIVPYDKQAASGP